ncbi:Arginine decarboxylase [Tenacibaculum litopenaei]|jgi:uncharacterized lipoprotein YmbA|uniref:DUF4266 domain-containing protein n=1 Tax=Tenacibaculum litopenaei TaxID=396016 RepID=UPI0038935715
MKKLWIIGAVALLMAQCSSVKPYQKMYLNDEDMALSSRKIEQYEINSQNYREGASGANGSKAGGGCGCN